MQVIRNAKAARVTLWNNETHDATLQGAFLQSGRPLTVVIAAPQEPSSIIQKAAFLRGMLCSTGVEPDKDLAVLKIQNLSKNALRPVAVGSSGGLQVCIPMSYLFRSCRCPLSQNGYGVDGECCLACRLANAFSP